MVLNLIQVSWICWPQVSALKNWESLVLVGWHSDLSKQKSIEHRQPSSIASVCSLPFKFIPLAVATCSFILVGGLAFLLAPLEVSRVIEQFLI